MPSNSILIKENLDALLKPMGLKKQTISNEGNCFFRAISDQLWAHQDKHGELRQKTTDYMRANPKEFTPWIVAISSEGGECRRSAGRAAKKPVSKAGAFFDSLPQEETDRIVAATYNKYVEKMCRDGTWAGEHEMLALANAMGINILIYSLNSGKAKKLTELTVTCKVWNSFTKTAKIFRHEYNHFSSVQPILPQFGEWRGLKPEARDSPPRVEIAPISKPNSTSVINFAPRAATYEIRGSIQMPAPQPKLPPTKVEVARGSLNIPPETLLENRTPLGTSKKPSSSGASASKNTGRKPTTSKLSAPAGICKAKSQPKTVIQAAESKYLYPGKKLPMTRTAMRMECAFLGKDEGKLFKLVEKNVDGTAKVYRGEQKITVVKRSI